MADLPHADPRRSARLAPLVALQLEYHLVERAGERDLLPMAQELGLGGVLHPPLAGDVLTGKYSRRDLDPGTLDEGDSARKRFNLTLGGVNERSPAIADNRR